jgi:very-short-patch-repair endonuclease
VGPFFPDYYCTELKLCIEIDGPDHDVAADSERDHWMQLRGITVMRFGVQEIDRNLEGVVSTIMNTIRFLQDSKATG